MIIKSADDTSPLFADLERLSTDPDAIVARRAREELARRRAGLKGERESTYLIDFDYGQNPNWAVVHDLRLEHAGRVAQIDHLLINRWLRLYVLETKHFHAGLKITDEGEFLRWNDYKKTYEGLPSPIQQNERHIAVLREVVAAIPSWPTRLGIRLPPSYHNLVLVAPNARIDRSKRFDCSGVIKADQLKPTIWSEIDNESPMTTLASLTKMVSSETVAEVAREIAMRHVPMARMAASIESRAALGEIEPTTVARDERPTTQRPTAPATASSCKHCGGVAGSILYGRSYYFQCDACKGNTSVRVMCEAGHPARVRKSGREFFRECADCKSSALYFTNPQPH